MKTLWLAVAVVISGAFLPLYALMADSPAIPMDKPIAVSTNTPASPTASGMGQAQGVIDQLDPVKKVIRIRDATGQEDAFFVDTNTAVYDSAHRQRVFEDLRPGDPVSISFSAVDNTVHQILKLKG